MAVRGVSGVWAAAALPMAGRCRWRASPGSLLRWQLGFKSGRRSLRILTTYLTTYPWASKRSQRDNRDYQGRKPAFLGTLRVFDGN